MATSAYGWDSFFSTTLSSAITATDTTIPLVAAPTAQEGTLTIEANDSTNREIIYYTSVSGNSVICPSVGAGRGQEGTTARAHSSGVTVKRNTTSRDFEVLQDGTGFTDGTHLPKHLMTGTGSSWTWQSWTPTYTNITIGNGTVNHSVYVQIGKVVYWAWKLTIGSTTVITDPGLISFPVTPSSKFTTTITSVVGSGTYNDGGGAFFPITCVYRTSGSSGINPCVINAGGTYATYNGVASASTPVVAAVGDIIELTGSYEAA